MPDYLPSLVATFFVSGWSITIYNSQHKYLSLNTAFMYAFAYLMSGCHYCQVLLVTHFLYFDLCISLIYFLNMHRFPPQSCAIPLLRPQLNTNAATQSQIQFFKQFPEISTYSVTSKRFPYCMHTPYITYYQNERNPEHNIHKLYINVAYAEVTLKNPSIMRLHHTVWWFAFHTLKHTSSQRLIVIKQQHDIRNINHVYEHAIIDVYLHQLHNLSI